MCHKRFPYKQNAAIHLKRKHKLPIESADEMITGIYCERFFEKFGNKYSLQEVTSGSCSQHCRDNQTLISSKSPLWQLPSQVLVSTCSQNCQKDKTSHNSKNCLSSNMFTLFRWKSNICMHALKLQHRKFIVKYIAIKVFFQELCKKYKGCLRK